MNRAFCGKSMKLGTCVHHTKPSKFSYSAKPDLPRGGFGGHLKKWPLFNHISETIGIEPSLSTPYIGFLGRRFQKRYCRIHHAIVSAILEAIQAKWQTKKKAYLRNEEAQSFNFDSMSMFCGAHIS